jgi:hypothetical protein
MSGLNLALCDADETYCQRLYGYLKQNLNLSFDIYSFTDPEDLKNFAKEQVVNLLIISEDLHYELAQYLKSMLLKNIIVLDEGMSESSCVCEPSFDPEMNIRHVSKYQSAAGLLGELVDFCAETPDTFTGLCTQAKVANSNIIGFFSPVSKCGQTTMAIRCAERLSRQGSVIFLSFESFSSLPQMLGVEAIQDITDLVYYAECEKSKFGLYLEKIKQSVGGVDYLMPAGTAAQVREIGSEKVKELLGLLSKEGGYDYIVMDLTEHPDGFFEILSMCNKIFTITKNSPGDLARISQYEAIVRELGLSKIEAATVKCQLPDLRDKASYDKCIEELLCSEGLIDGNKA